jgi:hypothetical protein
MNKDLLNYNLLVITEQLTTTQILHARRFRNWVKFDSLDEVTKLIFKLEELEIYVDDIDPEYKPNH